VVVDGMQRARDGIVVRPSPAPPMPDSAAAAKPADSTTGTKSPTP